MGLSNGGKKFSNKHPEERQRIFKKMKVAAEVSLGTRTVSDRQIANSQEFKDKCDNLGVKPTARQAAKMRKGYGVWK